MTTATPGSRGDRGGGQGTQGQRLLAGSPGPWCKGGGGEGPSERQAGSWGHNTHVTKKESIK